MKTLKWLIFAGILVVGAVIFFRRSDDKNLISQAPGHSPRSPREEPVNQPRKPAQSAGLTPSPVDSLQKFLQTKDSQAMWSVQNHRDGRPSHILGGRIQIGNNAGALTALLKEISPYLGVRGEDLRIHTEDDRTEVSNSSQMTQYYGKYRVYGALVKAFSNPNTHEVYHIVSDLRPLSDVDTRINISRSEAGELAQKTFGNAEINIIKISQEPVVYGTNPTDNQLVWRVLITSEKPRYQSREILVSAQSGSVVHTQNMLKH